MSDFISDYGEQLRQAGWRRLERRGRWSRRPAPGRPAKRAAVALVVLFAATPAVAATGVWRPLLGSADPHPPKVSTAPAASAQRALLAVLRRPQTPLDRGPQTRYALQFLGGSVAGVRTSDIRLLHTYPDGRGLVLIPVARYGISPPGTPAALRARRRHGRDGLCLFASDMFRGKPAGGGFGCFGTQDLLAGRIVAGLGRRVYGLVPDGVDRVQVGGVGRRMIEAKVAQNLFLYTGALGQPRWLDAQGRMLADFSRSSGRVPAPAPSGGPAPACHQRRGCAYRPQPEDAPRATP